MFGSVAITFNLANVDTLALDAPTLARIFNGEITSWNDPAITRLNQSMPAQPIHVVYRSDQSGTSDTFQHYLEAASGGAWGKGAGRTWNGGVGEGAEGNQGAATAVNSTDGAIGYAEWSFAQAAEPRVGEHRHLGGPRSSSHQRRIRGQDHRGRQGVGRRQ